MTPVYDRCLVSIRYGKTNIGRLDLSLDEELTLKLPRIFYSSSWQEHITLQLYAQTIILNKVYS